MVGVIRSWSLVNTDDFRWNSCSNGLVGSPAVSIACCALTSGLPITFFPISMEATNM